MSEIKEENQSAEDKKFEENLEAEFRKNLQEGNIDLDARLNGVKCQRGSSGKQFVGYNTLEQFYRGDQWDHDEPAGASQRTDNYCATIVDNFSSLLFDAPVEINCPSADESDEELEMKAELKERLLMKTYEDNDADEIVFPEAAKVGSEFGDSFIKGPMIDKTGGEKRADWKIVFFNVDNPANIILIFKDGNYKELYGFIDKTPISPMMAEKSLGESLRKRGKSIEEIIKKNLALHKGTAQQPNISGAKTNQSMLYKYEYWTENSMGVFLEDELVDSYKHDYGFVPIEYVKNNYVPNYPYGKADIEDVIDPQLAYTQTTNDLANALRFLSTINLKGKNLDGMEVLVHGLSKIFNIPDEGELDPIQRSGDPYASANQINDKRRTILDISGMSEALTSNMGTAGVSGRAMSVALQSVIRKLNPKIKRWQKALRSLNRNILKLYEKYWPETKVIIMGDYNNKVSIISTLLRNIIDELNKLQSGVQSLTTTQTNVGIPQPKIEQKRMKRDLADPVLGPQFARQPALLPQQQPPAAPQLPGGMPNAQMTNPEGAVSTSSDGTQLPNVPNQNKTTASPSGSVAASNQRASGGAAIPVNSIIP